jgi:AcrR family transcriptional regulator
MDTKERIIIESLKLFMRFGIRSITMDTIAKNLGTSKRTIYELFKNKDELLESCIVHRMAEEEKNNAEIMKNSANIIEAFLTHIKKNINLMSSISPMFFRDARKYHPEVFRRKGNEREEKDYVKIVGYINTGKQEGFIRQEINVDIIAKLMKEQFKIIGNDELFPPDRYSKSEIFENIAINFIRGIATDEGLKIINKFEF